MSTWFNSNNKTIAVITMILFGILCFPLWFYGYIARIELDDALLKSSCTITKVNIIKDTCPRYDAQTKITHYYDCWYGTWYVKLSDPIIQSHLFSQRYSSYNHVYNLMYNKMKTGNVYQCFYEMHHPSNVHWHRPDDIEAYYISAIVFFVCFGIACYCSCVLVIHDCIENLRKVYKQQNIEKRERARQIDVEITQPFTEEERKNNVSSWNKPPPLESPPSYRD